MNYWWDHRPAKAGNSTIAYRQFAWHGKMSELGYIG